MHLVGAIVGTVFTAIYTVIMLIGITAIFELLSAAGGAPGSGLLAVVSLLILVVGLLALIFNAMVIGAFSWDHEKYAKKRGKIVAAIVFNFLLALLMTLSVIGNFNMFAFLVLLASLAAAVLMIVDLALEGKRVAKAQAALEAAQPAEQSAPSAQAAGDEADERRREREGR